MVNCIWKISLISFRKCYVSFGFELPLARCQSMERQDFRIFCRPSSFSGLSALSTSQTVTPNLIDLTIFWKNLIRYFSSTLIFFLQLSAEKTYFLYYGLVSKIHVYIPNYIQFSLSANIYFRVGSRNFEKGWRSMSATEVGRRKKF